jgi:RND superfamily putative drug exporter
MQRRPIAARLARICASHPWRVLGAWLLVLVVGAILAGRIGTVLTSETTFTSEPDSVKADRLEERLRGPRPVTETVIVTSATLTADDAGFREVVERTVADLNALDGVVATATSPYDAPQGLIAADRHSALIPVTLAGEFDEAKKHATTFLDTVHRERGSGVDVLTIGNVSLDHTYGTMAEQDLRRGESIGAAVALIVLIIVFGALVAAGLPLLLGVVAIVVAIGLATIVGSFFNLAFMTTNVITMIGLAVGIDYSLFIVERYREERRHGLPKLDAIEVAGSTATRAVVFSATTVVLALCGMFVVPFSIFRSIGVGAILVVIVAVIGAMTLIPALLGLVGNRIDWPRRTRYSDVVVRGADGPIVEHGFWSRVAHAVMARPIVSAALAAALLIGAALPYFGMTTGFAGLDAIPPSESRDAYALLAREFTVGRLTPVEIAVDGSRDDARVAAAVDRLVATLGSNLDYSAVLPVEWSRDGTIALVSAYSVHGSTTPEAYQAIRALRGQTIPTIFGGTGARAYVTGESAGTLDFFDAVDRATPIVFAFVLSLCFVLLMLVFHSIVVPLKAIVMNLLSVGAAYGLLVLVFQHGVGAGLFGFQQTPVITVWLPIFLFCILFGLSMDYHVFLLSRIREHHDLTGNNREAVAVGLQTTAKIITGAALIMVAVFGGFAAGRMVELQQMGFGLAVAVFVDATIVRTVLVPSTMALLGEWNWYFPRRLRWLPDLGEAHHAHAPANWP